MRIFLFVLVATILEATGDAIVRIALNQSSLATRAGLILLGGILLTLYGTSLNLAPVDFATVTGVYIATLFVVFQVVNYLFFHVTPTAGVLIGGGLIVAGGIAVFVFRPA
jgi:small multidrug resistance family-3 protein